MKKRFFQVLSVPFAILMTALFGCNARIYSTDTIKQLPKEEYLAKLKTEPDAYIIDVRTGYEYRKGHLDGAISMNIISSSFDEKLESLDTSRTVFLYCETAHRSPFATMKLKKLGFKRIYDLKNGYTTLRGE